MTNYKKLQGWNIGMAVLQLCMALFLFGWFEEKDFMGKYYLLYDYDIEVINDKISTKIVEGTKLYQARETISFFVITGLFHTIYAMNIGNHYDSMIQSKNNYLRWLEYSITATLMIRIVAVQAGIKDGNTLALLTTNTIAIMLQGQIVEYMLINYHNNKNKEQSRNVIYICTAIGWALMIVNFYTIVNSFSKQVKTFNDLNCEEKVPDFVYAIVITQLFFYGSFGFIQLYQIYTVFTSKEYDYSKFELAYLVDSLVSKFTLGSLLAYSVVGASEGQESVLNCN